MAVNKIHREFYQVDVATGWETPPGYPAGIKQKILSGFLDSQNRTGGHTRLLKFEPGTYSSVPFEHDYWEEVFVLEGDLWVGSTGATGGERFGPHTYCVRPPPCAARAIPQRGRVPASGAALLRPAISAWTSLSARQTQRYRP